MKTFCFTVDDNIRFLKDITESLPESIFDHPYLAMYRRLHREFYLRVQLNLFFRTEGFDLTRMPARYAREWEENAHWLKLSFHADCEKDIIYADSGYDEVYDDCKKVNGNILRFASRASLADTTTVHYCQTTEAGVRALADQGVKGLLGLFGNPMNPKTSYSLPEEPAAELRGGRIVRYHDMDFAAINLVLNNYTPEAIREKLDALKERESVRVMIHEQYFYPDYPAYQPDFEEKLRAAFSLLNKHGFRSIFFEELL